MSATKTTLPLDVARRAAERLLPAISSVVHAVQRDLFGEVVTVQARDLLDERLEELAQLRAISRTPPDGARPAWGERMRKFWLAAGGQVVQVDLFLAREDNWGAIYCIRTGPAAFSQTLVTHFKLRTPYRQQDGALVLEATGEVVPVPEEADYFRLAGVPYIDPEVRSAGQLHRLLTRR